MGDGSDAGGRADAVVLGAGHNGLVCAAYLARAGLDVVVVERSDRVGGACSTDEVAPGHPVAAAAHLVAGLDRRIVADLGLDVAIETPAADAFVPLEDGGGVLLWRDARRRAEALDTVAPGDGEGYERLRGLFEDAARRLRPLWSYPATRAQVRRALRSEATPDLFAETVESSIAEVAARFLAADSIRGAVAALGVLGSVAGPSTPGTASLYLHHVLGAEAGLAGYVIGGMGALAERLAERLRQLGGAVRLGADVAAIHVGPGARRAGGVVLASGATIEAAVVCSCADPHTTVALAPEGSLAPEFVEDVALMPSRGSVVKVNCALSALPRFRGRGGGPGGGPEHRARILVAPSVDYLQAAADAASGGRPSPAPLVEGWIQSAVEPRRGDGDGHTLSLVAQWAPYDLAEGSWEERREEIGDLVIAALARHAPGLEDLIVERTVLGPPDLEARFGLRGGHPLHGEMLPDWLWDARPAGGWHRYRTPLAGLYLCGAGSHPGGGITGAPGRNAARAVLSDLVEGGSRGAAAKVGAA